MVKEFENKWGLILGGSSGLGLATAVKLAAHRMNLIIVHRDTRENMKEVEKSFHSISQAGIRLLTFNKDAVRDVDEIIRKIQSEIGNGNISCMIHSIAKGSLKPMTGNQNLSSEDFRITVDSMAISLYDWTDKLLKANILSTDTRIIAFTSEGSRKSMINYAAVSAAKASLEAISRSIALEMAPFGVKSNCICAGVTDTKSMRRIPNSDKILAIGVKRNPNNRLTTPEDIANVAYLLCKDEARWITGTTIIADGGESLG